MKLKSDKAEAVRATSGWHPLIELVPVDAYTTGRPWRTCRSHQPRPAFDLVKFQSLDFPVSTFF